MLKFKLKAKFCSISSGTGNSNFSKWKFEKSNECVFLCLRAILPLPVPLCHSTHWVSTIATLKVKIPLYQNNQHNYLPTRVKRVCEESESLIAIRVEAKWMFHVSFLSQRCHCQPWLELHVVKGPAGFSHGSSCASQHCNNIVDFDPTLRYPVQKLRSWCIPGKISTLDTHCFSHASWQLQKWRCTFVSFHLIGRYF